jgi:hypothetical protein
VSVCPNRTRDLHIQWLRQDYPLWPARDGDGIRRHRRRRRRHRRPTPPMVYPRQGPFPPIPLSLPLLPRVPPQQSRRLQRRRVRPLHPPPPPPPTINGQDPPCTTLRRPPTRGLPSPCPRSTPTNPRHCTPQGRTVRRHRRPRRRRGYPVLPPTEEEAAGPGSVITTSRSWTWSRIRRRRW